MLNSHIRSESHKLAHRHTGSTEEGHATDPEMVLLVALARLTTWPGKKPHFQRQDAAKAESNEMLNSPTDGSPAGHSTVQLLASLRNREPPESHVEFQQRPVAGSPEAEVRFT